MSLRHCAVIAQHPSHRWTLTNWRFDWRFGRHRTEEQLVTCTGEALPSLEEIEDQQRPVCPTHGIRDCSSLLNGCSWPTQEYERRVNNHLHADYRDRPKGFGFCATCGKPKPVDRNYVHNECLASNPQDFMDLLDEDGDVVE